MKTNSRATEEPNIAQPPMLPRTAAAWLAVFGPGAIIASLTIGAGELIFSTRAGAIFGYRLLWFFCLILLLKWALVFASARHIVLSGAHPFQRWMALPGPAGWLPLVFLLLALICFPIWVGFHAGTVGTLLAALTNSRAWAHGAGHYVWGMAVLAGVLALVLTGGYSRLERLQLAVTGLMLLAVTISLFLLRPDWLDFFKGVFVPTLPEYPGWLLEHSEFRDRPVWLEAATYVGVMGGSGYDYLAYVSYLRDKHWGQSASRLATPLELDRMAADSTHANRQWIRAPLIDSALSFGVVFVFAAVFVACGSVVLEPQHRFPAGTELLTLQAEFVAHPWLRQLYFIGALLAMLGTLYGTIEVAPAVLREMVAAFDPSFALARAKRLRVWGVLWVGFGGLLVLILGLLHAFVGQQKSPPGLIALLTPANLFTGVLACGLICFLNFWADHQSLPRALRMKWPLALLNLTGGCAFVALGLKAYWDHSRGSAFVILAGTLAAGWIGAWLLKPRLKPMSATSIRAATTSEGNE